VRRCEYHIGSSIKFYKRKSSKVTGVREYLFSIKKS
jgi:hypothetical protein